MKKLLFVLLLFSPVTLLAQQKSVPMLSEVDFYKGNQQMKFHLVSIKSWDNLKKDSVTDFVFEMDKNKNDSVWIKQPQRIYTQPDSVLLKLNVEFESQIKIISFEAVFIHKGSEVLITINEGSQFPSRTLQKINNLRLGDKIVIRKVRAVGIKDGTIRSLNSATLDF